MKFSKLIGVVLLISTFSIQSCEKDENAAPVDQTGSLTSKNSNTINKALAHRTVKDCWILNADGTKGKKGVTCSLSVRGNCKPDKNGCDTSGNSIIDLYFSSSQVEQWGDGVLDNIDEDFVVNHWDFFLWTYENGYTLHPQDIIDQGEW